MCESNNKKTGSFIISCYFGIYFSGCSVYTNISRQNEIAIKTETNNKLSDETDSSSNNILADSSVIDQNDTTSTNTNNDTNATNTTNTYNNPIDEYFIPLINNASTQAERRDYQDTYRGVWKSEFENILKLLEEKSVYQKDKDDLIAYKNSVELLIESTQTIVVTHWLDDYNISPENHRNIWGNGTTRGLNQIRGEIYRDASMLLIEKMYYLNYKFIDRDYSKEHYE